MLPNVYRKVKIFTIKAILASFPYKLVKETMKLHLIHFVGSEKSCGTVSNENSNLLAFEIHFNLISEQIKKETSRNKETSQTAAILRSLRLPEKTVIVRILVYCLLSVC